jgi:hypothetical protein
MSRRGDFEEMPIKPPKIKMIEAAIYAGRAEEK